MRTPLHFSSAFCFKLYVLECALRDRESFRDAIACATDIDGIVDAKLDTDREIACIRDEICRLRYKAKERQVES